jgi:hypothetical protein
VVQAFQPPFDIIHRIAKTQKGSRLSADCLSSSAPPGRVEPAPGCLPGPPPLIEDVLEPADSVASSFRIGCRRYVQHSSPSGAPYAPCRST